MPAASTPPGSGASSGCPSDWSGPRANLAVSGVLITLFVQQRASGALAVTFALTADRLVSWLTYPVVGQVSDRTRSRVGRRTPVHGRQPHRDGRGHLDVHRGPRVLAPGADDPDRRTGVGGVHPHQRGRGPRGVRSQPMDQGPPAHHRARHAGQPDHQGDGDRPAGSRATRPPGTFPSRWRRSSWWRWASPCSSWSARRRPPPTVPRPTGSERARPTRDELRGHPGRAQRQGAGGGSLLFWSGVGSTAYVAILFFQRVLHAGASAQTIAGLATGLPVFFVGIALGIPLSRSAQPHAAGRRRTAGRGGAGRGAVLRHPHLAGGGAELHRRTVRRRLHHRDGPVAPPACCRGPAASASGSACCWLRSTCAAWSWPTSPPWSSTPPATTG